MDDTEKKRPLDDDDDDDRSNKRRKYDCDDPLQFPPDDNIPKVIDEKKWNSLPGIVYELLSLFKKGDKTNDTTIADEDDEDDDDKTKHTNYFLGVEEKNVLPNQNQEVNKLLNTTTENNNDNPIQNCVKPQNTIELNTELDSAIKNYSQNLEKLDYMINGTVTVFEHTKSTPVENIEKNIVEKKNISVGVKEEKLNVLPNQNCGGVDNSSTDVNNLIGVGSNNLEAPNIVKHNLRKIDCFINESKNVQIKISVDNKSTTSRENLKNNYIKKANQKEDESNKKTSIFEKYRKNVPENSAQNDNILYPENLLRLPKKDHLLTLLKIQCLNGISESNLPISKPPPCNCVFCMKVDNLPTDKCKVNNLYSSKNGSTLHHNYENSSVIHSDMYNSNLTASDCSICASQGIFTTNNCFCANQSSSKKPSDIKPLITPKNIWVNNLKHLIRKNEETFKVFETTNKSSKSSLVPQQNAIQKVYNTAKFMIDALCNFCKHSKYSCKCNRKNTKRDNNDMPFHGYHGSYRSSRY
ncbi:Hypothetical protein CINCED_3A004048 [Cinara cedri]|uniref:Uncharacterized protein n=1 Tax=Cinara cedri TaxID=506608 RepID=A0A5E4MNB3_9HEMI|nr:Hypothetical protein CINCED_3A004048 [Cinara cedri]